MSILQKHLTFVNEQIKFQEKMAEKFASNTFRQTLHNTSRDKYISLLADLESADKELDKEPPKQLPLNLPSVPKLSLSPKELEGLPQEVLDELNISQSDKIEFAILEIIEKAGGIASLDQLLVALYRKTLEPMKRQNLTSKLYRMGVKEQVFSVPTKKGVYSDKLISVEDAARIFGNDDLNDSDSASPNGI